MFDPKKHQIVSLPETSPVWQIRQYVFITTHPMAQIKTCGVLCRRLREKFAQGRHKHRMGRGITYFFFKVSKYFFMTLSVISTFTLACISNAVRAPFLSSSANFRFSNLLSPSTINVTST